MSNKISEFFYSVGNNIFGTNISDTQKRSPAEQKKQIGHSFKATKNEDKALGAAKVIAFALIYPFGFALFGVKEVVKYAFTACVKPESKKTMKTQDEITLMNTEKFRAEHFATSKVTGLKTEKEIEVLLTELRNEIDAFNQNLTDDPNSLKKYAGLLLKYFEYVGEEEMSKRLEEIVLKLDIMITLPGSRTLQSKIQTIFKEFDELFPIRRHDEIYLSLKGIFVEKFAKGMQGTPVPSTETVVKKPTNESPLKQLQKEDALIDQAIDSILDDFLESEKEFKDNLIRIQNFVKDITNNTKRRDELGIDQNEVDAMNKKLTSVIETSKDLIKAFELSSDRNRKMSIFGKDVYKNYLNALAQIVNEEFYDKLKKFEGTKQVSLPSKRILTHKELVEAIQKKLHDKVALYNNFSKADFGANAIIGKAYTNMLIPLNRSVAEGKGAVDNIIKNQTH